MAFNAPVFTLALVAAASTGIATSQSLGAAGNLTLNGSLVTGGVATFDVARRVGITSVGNDTGLTWTIAGTDRYGRAQSEALTGAGAGLTVQSLKDYLTVTKIAGSAATASTVTAGTTSVGSTAPYVVDTFVNPSNYGVGFEITGTVTTGLEGAMIDLTPSWDLANNTVAWYSITGATSVSSNQQSTITGPFTMIRLTNTSGTGTAKARLVVPFLAGA